MDQDRRDAQAWAQEWAIRRRNKNIIKTCVIIAGIILFGFAVNYVTIQTTRMVFDSEEEMRQYLQGRFVHNTIYSYDDIEIQNKSVTITSYERSHYDLDYARRMGYSEYGDYVYDDEIAKLDYKNGVIELEWGTELIVNKDGSLTRYSETYYKTDEPKPTPIDPKDVGVKVDEEAMSAPEEQEENLPSEEVEELPTDGDQV